VDFPDTGGSCGRVDGCAVLGDPQAAAMAACRRDGFTCEVSVAGVVGYRNGAGWGSNCSNGDVWRLYCFANADERPLGFNCILGNIYPGHSPCRNYSGVARIGTWCDQ